MAGLICGHSQPRPPLVNFIKIISAGSVSACIKVAELALYLHGFSDIEIEIGKSAMVRGSIIVRIVRMEKIKEYPWNSGTLRRVKCLGPGQVT